MSQTRKANALTAGQERLVVTLSAVMTMVLHVVGFSGVRLDDAYITFRYGENLARGRGFVFNEGQRLLGTTSPGQALIAAVVHTVAGHEALPSVMSALGAAGWTLQAWLVYWALRARLGGVAATVTAFGIAAGAARSYAFVPLETNLVAAAIVASFVLALRGRHVAAAAALGVAVVLRADAVLAGLPLLALAVADLGRRISKPLAAAACAPLAWAGFAFAYFGTVLPLTLVAKAHHSSLAGYASHICTLPISVLLPSVSVVPLLAGLAAWLVVLVGWGLSVMRDRRLALFPAWMLLHLTAYLVLRPDTTFPWHLYPANLVAVIGILLAIAFAARRAPRPVAVAAMIATPACVAWNTLVFSVQYEKLTWYGARDEVDRAVAEFMRDRAAPGDIADAEEVGTLAYYSDLKMVDHPGLVTLMAYTPDGLWTLPRHCQVLQTLSGLRFVVMNDLEVRNHRCIYGDRPLYRVEKPGIPKPWRLWVADLHDASAASSSARSPAANH